MTTPSGGPSGTPTPLLVKTTGRSGNPKYGIVKWRDATSATKIRLGRLKKNLPIKVTMGLIFTDPDGTLAIVQEYHEGTRGVERDGEFTLVPADWVVEIIPLVMVSASPAAGGSGCDPEQKGSTPPDTPIAA